MQRNTLLVLAAIVLVLAIGTAMYYSGRGTPDTAQPPAAPVTQPATPATPPPAQ